MEHSDAVKAQVIVDWQAGASLNALASTHDVPKTTVARWVKGMERVTLVREPVPKRTLADLSYELATESFNAAIAILQLAQDREWLTKQNANDLAIFFGVNADKLYRLLPAFVGTVIDSNSDANAVAD